MTVALGTGDVLHLASQIGALLSTLQGSSSLEVITNSGNSLPAAPTVSGGTQTELLITGAFTGPATVPNGYSYVVDNSTAPSTLSGTNVALIAGTTGGSFSVSGQSTVAAQGGDNEISATGVYLISTGPTDDNVIGVAGIGTVATSDIGSNLIYAAGVNDILSNGQDTVLSGAGLTTVNSTGSNSLIVGSPYGDGYLTVSVTGSQTTVAAATSNTTATLAGSSDWVFGGNQNAGTLSVFDMGTNDSVYSGDSPTTVTAGSGSSGLVVFGGHGGLTFLGGDNASTVLSGPGGANSIVGGRGGILDAAGGNDTVTGQQWGGATLFGTANHAITYLGDGNLIYAAGFGNETLNAAASTGTNALFALGYGNDSIAGGSGTNFYDAGAGSDTFTGGSGENAYFFLASNTAGSHDFITNLGETDGVALIGYDRSQSQYSVSNGSLTVTLSDQTQITFVNVTDARNNIHYL